MKFGDVCGAVEEDRPVRVPDDFAATVMKAARNARKARDIGLFQLMWLQGAINRPRTLQKIYGGVIDKGIESGLMMADAEADGFDWDSLLAFIERLLPLILQLIAIF
jgi:hypothetical protein